MRRLNNNQEVEYSEGVRIEVESCQKYGNKEREKGNSKMEVKNPQGEGKGPQKIWFFFKL